VKKGGAESVAMQLAACECADAICEGDPGLSISVASRVQGYLYFCWLTTRPMFLFRRCLSALLFGSIRNELRIVELQKAVLRTLTIQEGRASALLAAAKNEEATRRTFQLGDRGNPRVFALLGMLHRADPLLARLAGTMFARGALVVDVDGEVRIPRPSQRRRFIYLTLVVSVILSLPLAGIALLGDPPFGRVVFACVYAALNLLTVRSGIRRVKLEESALRAINSLRPTRVNSAL